MRLGAVLVFLAMYSRGRFAFCHDTGHARRVTKLLRESSYRLVNACSGFATHCCA